MLLTAEAVLAVSIIAVKFQSGHEFHPWEHDVDIVNMDVRLKFQSGHELSLEGTKRIPFSENVVRVFQSGHDLSLVELVGSEAAVVTVCVSI